MEEFRELVLLLKNYSADDQIALIDQDTIRQLPLRKATAPHLARKADDQHDRGSTIHPELRQRLWNTLLFMDLNHEDTADSNRVAYLCWQRLAALKTLMAVGAIKSLREIAESLLQLAKTYELTTVVIETAAQLRQICALHDGNMRDFEKYCHLIKQYEQYLEAEQAAEDEYIHFLLQQFQHGAPTEILVQWAEAACLRLSTYRSICSSHSFLLNFHYLQLQSAFLSRKWPEVVQICTEADQQLCEKKVRTPRQASGFFLCKALGLANLRELPAALDFLSKAIQTEKEGSPNWYQLMVLKLNWLLHQQAYLPALELFKQLDRPRGETNTEWPIRQKRFYATVLLHLLNQGWFKISNRTKGTLMLNAVPMDVLPWNTPAQLVDIEHQTSFLLLKLEQWVRDNQAAEAAQWLRQYVRNHHPVASPPLRLTALIQALEDIGAGQHPSRVWQQCLQTVQQTPLDYSTPESALEVLPLEFLLQALF